MKTLPEKEKGRVGGKGTSLCILTLVAILTGSDITIVI